MSTWIKLNKKLRKIIRSPYQKRLRFRTTQIY